MNYGVFVFHGVPNMAPVIWVGIDYGTTVDVPALEVVYACESEAECLAVARMVSLERLIPIVYHEGQQEK